MVLASVVMPGGGWRNGSLARKEAIGCASLLPVPLESVETELCAPSRADKNSCFYTSRGACSPAVPIVRDDDGRWLDDRPRVGFFSVASPDVGTMRQNLHAVDRPRVEADLRAKMRNTLRAFARTGCTTLVLGAFGCGVFADDPTVVAALWRDLLTDPGLQGRCAKVVFAVPDPDSPRPPGFRAPVVVTDQRRRVCLVRRGADMMGGWTTTT